MKKRILALVLATLMLVSLVPMTAFADDGFAITNGTPESAKEKNHGYITVDETAAEGDKVEVTVVPNNGYKLKSLVYSPTPKTVADILPEEFPAAETDASGAPATAWKSATLDKLCYLSYDKTKLFFCTDAGIPDESFSINTDAVVSADEDENYVYKKGTVTVTFFMKGENGTLNSVTFANTANTTWDGTYQESACVAAGTVITMYNGEQKKVEDLEIGDVIRTFDHEKGEVSSSPVCFIWESKNAANAFTLTFEGNINVTVIEAHGFYDCDENRYVFINVGNAKDYIGHHFYNADTDSRLELKNIEIMNNCIDAYAVATSKHLNHLSNGMLSMCDGTFEKIANLFEYDNQMKYDAELMKKDIEDYGLTPPEKVLKYKGFNKADYYDYNLQYLDIALGKGLISYEWIEALSEYCIANNIYDILPVEEAQNGSETKKMRLMSASAPKKMLFSAPNPAPGDSVEIKADTQGKYIFTMPGYAVTVTAEFEEIPVTIADILPDDFPTSTAGAWLNAATGGKSYIMNGNLFVYGKTNVELSKPVTKKDDGNYEYQGTSGTKITFVMESGKLTKINVSGSVYPENNGTYVAPHVHTFTYDANGSVLTATCTDGCSGGYDDNPLTLTLTVPSSLVYDGKAKTVTFANGETDAWTTAGLQLPTITYTAKSGSSLTNDKAINAGSYTASITVNTNKTASLDFEITKATPYIKTNPAPNDIEYGEKLLDSTLYGGYVQSSSTDSTQVGGLFEWAEPNTMPAISDSNTTLYNVIFTPADETNYNTVSCQVTITVNHTHTPVLVNGQAPTEEATGWEDYYECICGEFYEDATGNVKIPDLDAWKAEGGNGYIAKLVHGTDADNDHICDYCKKVISDHSGELQKGVAATLENAGYKDYYKCSICGKLFEDEACEVEITNLDAWKAEGGNGYIAKLEPTPDPDPINYKVIEGANSVWVISAGESPVFRSNADFSKFSHVLLDGKELAKKYYKAESGSTIVTLKPEYAATLSVGKHTIEIVSTDGSAATAFYIEETIANTNGEGFALSTATMSSAFIGCSIVGLAVVFFELKKKKKVR